MLCCTVCVAPRPLPANKGGVGLIAVCQGPCSRVCAKASCGRIHAAGVCAKAGCVRIHAAGCVFAKASCVSGSMQQGVCLQKLAVCQDPCSRVCVQKLAVAEKKAHITHTVHIGMHGSCQLWHTGTQKQAHSAHTVHSGMHGPCQFCQCLVPAS